MNIYRVTFWKCLKPNINLLFLIFLLAGLMGGLMFILFHKDGSIPFFLIALTITALFLLVIPSLILQISYYMNDKRRRISIDSVHGFLSVIIDGKEDVFDFKDIVNIVRVGVRIPGQDVFVTNAVWRDFYYYRIELKSGDCIYVTRLLIQNLEKKVSNLSCNFEKKKYPIISKI